MHKESKSCESGLGMHNYFKSISAVSIFVSCKSLSLHPFVCCSFHIGIVISLSLWSLSSVILSFSPSPFSRSISHWTEDRHHCRCTGLIFAAIFTSPTRYSPSLFGIRRHFRRSLDRVSRLLVLSLLVSMWSTPPFLFLATAAALSSDSRVILLQFP